MVAGVVSAAGAVVLAVAVAVVLGAAAVGDSAAAAAILAVADRRGIGDEPNQAGNSGSFWRLVRPASAFHPALLEELTVAIGEGERRHRGELRLVVESRLSPWAVLRGLDARRRAIGLFAQLGIWDTEYNSGVLLYVLLAEHKVEVVADRGIASRVDQAAWDALCIRIRDSFARGEWRTGSLRAVADVHALLEAHFPGGDAAPRNELSDRPVLL